MKRLLTKLILIIVLFSGISILVQAQNIGTISTNLQKGNAQALSIHFAENVELSIWGSEKNHAKNSATQQIKAFFTKHQPHAFKIKHRGSAPDGSRFFIGTIQTNNGNFRTYIGLKQGKIHKLSFKK